MNKKVKLIISLMLVLTFVNVFTNNVRAITKNQAISRQIQLGNQIEKKVNHDGGYLHITSSKLKNDINSVYYWDKNQANKEYQKLNGFIQIIKQINNRGGFTKINLLDLRNIIQSKLSFDKNLANKLFDYIKNKMMTNKSTNISLSHPLGNNPIKDVLDFAWKQVSNWYDASKQRLSSGNYGNIYYCNWWGQACARNAFWKIWVPIGRDRHYHIIPKRRLFYFKNDCSMRENVGFWHRSVGPRHHQKHIVMYSTGITGMYLSENHKINHHWWYFDSSGYGHRR